MHVYSGPKKYLRPFPDLLEWILTDESLTQNNLEKLISKYFEFEGVWKGAKGQKGGVAATICRVLVAIGATRTYWSLAVGIVAFHFIVLKERSLSIIQVLFGKC